MSKQQQQLHEQTADIEAVAGIGQESVQNAMKSYSAWLTNASQVQTEALRFITDRIRKDMEMPARFAACKSPADVLQEQLNFANTMLADYAEESQKLVGIMNEAASQAQRQMTAVKDH